MSTLRPLSRRTVLRGLGAAVALPWLDAMTPARAAPTPPRRLAFLYVPNGMDMPRFTPATEGPLDALPPILEPLDAVKDAVLVLSGLTHDKARANGDGPGDHARASAAFLTGAQPRKTSGSDIYVGVSVDQVAARHRGNATALPSLELGVEPARQAGSCDSGYSCAYSSSISWRTPRSPMGKEVHPRLAFDRLVSFGPPAASAEEAARRRQARTSVLDHALDDARRLERRLGRADRHKLEEYLTALRQLERRIERAAPAGDTQAGSRPPPRLPKDRREHLRLLLDVAVLAFRTDRTRIVTCMFANEGSNHAYGFLRGKGGHHEISHHGGDEAKIQRIRAINRYHMSELAVFLRALREAPEGEGSVLDHSLIVYGSGIADGNRHAHHDLPILLAGGGGGTVDSGRHVRFPTETPVCNLYLSVLDRFGVEVPTHGDATGRLEGLGPASG